MSRCVRFFAQTFGLDGAYIVCFSLSCSLLFVHLISSGLGPQRMCCLTYVAAIYIVIVHDHDVSVA